MLARTFQFGEAIGADTRPILASPQASIMKALVEGFMSHQPVAYLLFGVGAMIALALEMLGQPSLIFALGMYLPLELNTPALVGGFLSHFLNKRSERTGGEAGKTIRERGVIIASGSDGRRRARRRTRRGPAPLPLVSRRPDQNSVLFQRTHFSIRFRALLHRAVLLRLVRFRKKQKELS